jgi:outer membrane protein assembly factor BamB
LTSTLTAIRSLSTRTPSQSLVRAYDAGTGAVLWTDRFDSTGFDQALAIAADAGRVFAAGQGGDNQDFLVRAYDAATGTLLWQDQFDGGGLDVALAVAAQSGRVFAAGSGGTQFLVRAYDAANGSPLWQDMVNLSIFGAQAIAVDSSRVIVAAENFTVRAYDAATGGFLWQDKFADGVRANAVAAEQGRVFVAGRGVGMGGGAFLAVAYDAATGALLWQNRFDKRKSLDVANAIVALNGKVSAAGARYKGAVRPKEWVVRTYDGVTGALLWQDRFDVRRSEDEARAIAADTGRVFAVGTSADDFLVRAYAVE